MPRCATHALIWSPGHHAYEWRAPEQARPCPVREADDGWAARLAACSSFSFQGRSGRLTLRRESRPRGEEAGYWYAYRSQDGRTVKRYAGRTTDLTIARLEAIARALTPTADSAQVDYQPPFSVLAPKLQVPRPRASLVARARLLARLDAGLERKLTLLCAPAGFGKTTLVSQWVADRRLRGDLSAVAWLSLDPGDDDPVRFWRYVIAACQTLRKDLGAAARALLLAARSPWSASFGQPSLEPMLTALLNELAALTGTHVLILEDYHAIASAQIHESVATLIEHLPPALHLILTARSVPPLPLPRLRAR